MAGIFTRFTLRSLAQNRVRTAVTVVGIALSTALLAAVLTSVASVQQGLPERTLVTEGSWHVYSPDVPAQGIDALVESDAVTDLATFRDLGSAALAPDDANRLGAFIALKTAPTTVKGVDEPGGAPYSLMPELASGRWPETAGEIVLPDYLQGEELGAGGAEGVVSNGPLETGSTLTGGVGNLAAAEDGARLADGNETRVENARERTLTVTGFYKRQAPFLANNYTASSAPSVALTVADASEEGAAAGAYLVTQGLGTLDEMKAFFADATGLDDTAATLYHTSLFSYLGISDGRPIWGSLWAVAAVLAVVIVVASVSLIYNAFAISVAERTRQFGLLASLGASKRQLRRTVLAEALLLGAVGVPLGLLAGVAGTAAAFAVSQEAFVAMLGSSSTGLAVHVDPGALAAAAALAIATLLASAWVPSARAARVSAVDAIRQTQDVHLSRRAERKASSQASGDARVKLGIAGRLFGIPGFVAHRNLSRSTARGRTVVASLAVSVMLVVIAGSASLYLAPLSERASSSRGAGSGADIAVSAYPDRSAPREGNDLSDHAAEFDEFLARTKRVEGLQFVGSCRQGQAESVVDGRMISQEARAVRQAYDSQTSAAWAPDSFGEDGDYYGALYTFFVDDASWRALLDELNLDVAAYTDPENPRAIALNKYQGATPDGAYVSMKPFASTGTVDLYAIEEREGFSIMGLQEGPDGKPLVGYLDHAADDDGAPGIVTVPADEAATAFPVEIGALCDEEPAALNAVAANSRFPSIILPETVAANASAPDDSHAKPYAYSFASASFTAKDHAKASDELESLARDYGGIVVNVSDIEEVARQNRLIAQAFQLFTLCFSIIMTLIAVANVFNTLANGIILRTREFATLRSTGMGNRAFARMLAYECASYALRGLGIGLAVAAAVTYALYRAMSLAFADLEFTLPWDYVALAVAIVAVVLALSVAYALRRSHASNIVEALRSDAI